MSNFRYSDGDDSENLVTRLLDEATSLESTTRIGWEAYANWAARYHLCPERGNLLRHFDFSGMRVAELGAGMGGVSRVIAEGAEHLTIVEGSARRLEANSRRLRDLKNWSAVHSNIVDYKPGDRFDVVCIVGVLEYSELYVSVPPGSDRLAPFQNVLTHARGLLKNDGILILAIENKLGLKYFSGCEEDHRNTLFDSITGYPALPSARTFSRRELTALATDSGFKSPKLYYPYPDYKVPTAVISERFIAELPKTAAEIAAGIEAESYVQGRIHLFPEGLAQKTLADAGTLEDFANSFLLVSANTPNSQVLAKVTRRENTEGEHAWVYSRDRKTGVSTTFKKSVAGDWSVSKDNLGASTPGTLFSWVGSKDQPVFGGENLRWALLRRIYFNDLEGFYSLFNEYCRTSIEKFRDPNEPTRLKPSAVDATFINCQITPKGFEYFDLEWHRATGVPIDWFIFRNVMQLHSMKPWFPKQNHFGTLKEVLSRLCADLGVESDFESSFAEEVRFQAFASGREIPPHELEIIRNIFEQPLAETSVPFAKTRQPHEIRQIFSQHESLVHEVSRLRDAVHAQHLALIRPLPVLIGSRLFSKFPSLQPIAKRLYLALKAVLAPFRKSIQN